jgi:hypothetical protein
VEPAHLERSSTISWTVVITRILLPLLFQPYPGI